MKYFLLMLFLSTAAMTVYAQNPEGNLFKDWTFADWKKNWIVVPSSSVSRSRIEGFDGQVEALYHLKGKGNVRLVHHNIPVKPDTWYKFTMHYRNTGNQSVPFGCYFGFSPQNAKGDWPVMGSFSGPAVNFIQPVMWFNSSNNTRLKFSCYIYSDDEWALGRFSLVPFDAKEKRPGVLQDPAFLRTKEGMRPADFRTVRKTGVRLETVRNKNGLRSVHFKMPPGRVFLRIPDFIAQKGERIRFTLKARSAKTAKITLSVVSPAGRFRKSAAQQSGKTAGLWEVDSVFQVRAGAARTALCQGYILVESGEENDIYFDSISLTVVPKQNAKPLQGNLLGRSPSFEGGLSDWICVFAEDPGHHSKGGRFHIRKGNAPDGDHYLEIMKPLHPAGVRKRSGYRAGLEKLITILPGKEYELSFYAKADRPTTVKAGFAYSNVGTFRIGTQWKKYTKKFVTSRSYSFGQNSNIFILNSPLDGAGLCLDALSITDKNNRGTLHNTPVSTGIDIAEHLYKIFPRGKKLNAKIFGANHQKVPCKADLTVEIKDLSGKVVSRTKRFLALAPGRTQDFTIPLKTDLNGYFLIESKISIRGKKEVYTAPYSYSVLPEPQNIPADRSYFGILDYTIKSSKLQYLFGGSTLALAPLYRSMGFKWVRMFSPGKWNYNEVQKGKYKFYLYDRLVNSFLKEKMKVSVDFHDGNCPKFAETKNRKVTRTRLCKFVGNMDDLADYTEAFCKYYKGRVSAVTLLSETGGYAVADYMKAMKKVSPIFRKHKITVMGPGNPSNNLPYPDGPDDTFINQVLKMGLAKYIDVLDIHPYQDGNSRGLAGVKKIPPEADMESRWGNKKTRLKLSIEKLHRTHGKLGIWDTESGTSFNSTIPSDFEIVYPWYTPRVAAGRMIRYGVACMALGIKRHMYFMFFASNRIHNLDLMNNDMTPRPGVAAFAAFAKMLDGSRFIRKEMIGKNTEIYLFRSYNGKTIAVYWDFMQENLPEGTLTLKGKSIQYKLYDLMANEVKSGRGNTLPLGDLPYYFVTDDPPEKAAQYFRNARVESHVRSILSAGIISDGRKGAAVVAGIRNCTANTLSSQMVSIKVSGALAGTHKAKGGVIRPGKTSSVKFPVKFNRPGKALIRVESTGYKGQTVTVEKPIFLFGNRIQGTVDGRIVKGEYGGAIMKLISKNKAVSGQVYGVCQNNIIRLAVAVKDKTDRVAPPGSFLYVGDSVEFYFDFAPERSHYSKIWHKDSIRIVLSPGGKAYKTARIAFDRNGFPCKTDDFAFIPAQKIKFASSRTKEGYIVELELPLAKKVPHVIGFDVQICDMDNGRKNNTGVNGTGKRCWDNIQNLGVAFLLCP